jgi:hypothetical protein
MKSLSFLSMAALAFLISGCSSPQGTSGVVEHKNVDVVERSVSNPAYDDHQITMIKRGETTEAQLVERFGPPASRDVKPDGRSVLAWSFSSGGALNVSLGTDGKVESYASRRPAS